jgi:hypothetical protein
MDDSLEFIRFFTSFRMTTISKSLIVTQFLMGKGGLKVTPANALPRQIRWEYGESV